MGVGLAGTGEGQVVDVGSESEVMLVRNRTEMTWQWRGTGLPDLVEVREKSLSSKSGVEAKSMRSYGA